MKYTEKEIEGIENLCRFLCSHQNELHSIITKAANYIYNGNYKKAEELLIMEVPIIQGTSNQTKLKCLGEQKTDTNKIRIGVDILLKKYTNGR